MYAWWSTLPPSVHAYVIKVWPDIWAECYNRRTENCMERGHVRISAWFFLFPLIWDELVMKTRTASACNSIMCGSDGVAEKWSSNFAVPLYYCCHRHCNATALNSKRLLIYDAEKSAHLARIFANMYKKIPPILTFLFSKMAWNRNILARNQFLEQKHGNLRNMVLHNSICEIFDFLSHFWQILGVKVHDLF